jgi:hypothetical protein
MYITHADTQHKKENFFACKKLAAKNGESNQYNPPYQMCSRVLIKSDKIFWGFRIIQRGLQRWGPNSE